jgi:hypothetical protein
VQSYLSNRWRLEITIGDIFKLTFKRLFGWCCQNSSPNGEERKNETFQERKMRLYKKGEEKVMRELDCVNIMMKMRQLELLLSLFLNSKQKFLLNF